MLHELTITVDDVVYQTLKPMVEQKTLGPFLYDFLHNHPKSVVPQPILSITTLRGTLHQVDTSDLREETDRPL
jgi:hypothetical protein